MSVISVESISLEGNYATVIAVVEDMRLRYYGSYYDPPEYEPALSTASFELTENETVPTEDDKLLEYINSLDLDWEMMSDDYDYDDYA